MKKILFAILLLTVSVQAEEINTVTNNKYKSAKFELSTYSNNDDFSINIRNEDDDGFNPMIRISTGGIILIDYKELERARILMVKEKRETTKKSGL